MRLLSAIGKYIIAVLSKGLLRRDRHSKQTSPKRRCMSPGADAIQATAREQFPRHQSQNGSTTLLRHQSGGARDDDRDTTER
jgi:hypothetical protein